MPAVQDKERFPAKHFKARRPLYFGQSRLHRFLRDSESALTEDFNNCQSSHCIVKLIFSEKGETQLFAWISHTFSVCSMQDKSLSLQRRLQRFDP